MDSIIPSNDDSPLKRCPKCPEGQQWHPATLEFFASYQRAKDGFQSWCRKCMKDYHEKYVSIPKNRERHRAYNEEYRNRPEIREHNKITERNRRSRPGWHERAAERQRAYNRKPENRERIQAYQNRPDVREHRRAWERERRKLPQVKERRNAASKDWKNRNHEHVITYHRDYYRRQNREHRLAVRRNYYRRNQGNFRVYLNNRRAHKMNAPGRYTVQDMREQYKQQKGKCYWCQKKITWEERTDDHIIPLSRGGTNWPDNMVVSCGSCNSRKHDKLPHEFPEGGRLL